VVVFPHTRQVGSTGGRSTHAYQMLPI